MITREHALHRLENYLRQQVAERDQLVDLTPSLDLIDNRVIDSLGFMGLLVVIEELGDQPVDVQQLSADDFRTLDRIGARFLAHLPSAEVARV